MFKYFNPLWLIQNFLQTNINPVTIGAGVGAVGSAVRGGNPIKGALLGGALGGMGQAAGLFGAGSSASGASSGSGLFSGLKGVESVVPSFGSGGYAALGQNALAPVATATTTTPTSLFTSPEFISPYTPQGAVDLSGQTQAIYNSGMADPTYLNPGYQFAQNAPNYNLTKEMLGKSADYTGGGYNPSFLGRFGDATGLSSVADWAKANPMPALSATGQVIQAVSPQEQAQQTMQPAIPPITRGTYNTAPTLGQGQNEKVATRLQITPNQLQLYPSFFRGGY